VVARFTALRVPNGRNVATGIGGASVDVGLGGIVGLGFAILDFATGIGGAFVEVVLRGIAMLRIAVLRIAQLGIAVLGFVVLGIVVLGFTVLGIAMPIAFMPIAGMPLEPPLKSATFHTLTVPTFLPVSGVVIKFAL
jgi:hypothetical protein